MGIRWPESGPWVVVPTSRSADWDLVAATLAAAADARVAVVVTGTAAPPGVPPDHVVTGTAAPPGISPDHVAPGTAAPPGISPDHVATWARLHDGDRDPLRLADALKIVDALARGHDLVLVVGAAGLLEPAGRAGWTAAGLAAALGSPVVVAVGPDPRGVNYTTVEAVQERGLASALVTVGDAPTPLPVDPRGRIPANPGPLDARIARAFLDPELHARREPRPDPAPEPGPGGARGAGAPGPEAASPRAGSPAVPPRDASRAASPNTGSGPGTALGAARGVSRAVPPEGGPGAGLPQPDGGTGWPAGGPWIVAPASGTADWKAVVTVLAAASTARVAAVAIGDAEPPGAPLTAHLATWIGLRAGRREPLRPADAVAVTGALARTHDLVLVIAVDWEPADLALALGAPVVVAAGDDPASLDRATAGLAAIDGYGLASAVVMVAAAPADAAPADVTPADAAPADAAPVGGGPAGADQADAGSGGPGPGSGGDPAGGGGRLPVAGRITGGLDGIDADTARALLDPMLHAAPPPVPPPRPVAGRTPAAVSLSRISASRLVLLLVALFVVMALGAVGLAYLHRTPTGTTTGAGTPPPFAEEDQGAEEGADEFTDEEEPPFRPVDACPGDQLRGKPARPDARTAERVDAAWTRIETWLAARAPLSHRTLRPPARPAAVDTAQRRIQWAFPPDLVASLLRHDGAESSDFTLPPGFRPMRVTEIVETTAMLCEIASGEPDTEMWWSDGLVPFADAGNGDHLVLDQRPGNHGRVGAFNHEDILEFAPWPASLADLLEQTATALETGRPFAGTFRPIVEDGVLNWDV